MKWSISKRLLLLVVLISPQFAYSENRHDRLQKKYISNWAKLIPSYSKIQFAGSMGFLSCGTGWDYGKKNQWETDFFLGYLPKFEGEKGHITLTLKENYIPWKLSIGKSRWLAEPFTVSLYLNKIFGDEFWTKEPLKYPEKYYNVATNLRINLAIGQRINFKLKSLGLSDQIAFFYEFNTSDLYIISYFTNKYLRFSDIFSLSLGLKFQFL